MLERGPLQRKLMRNLRVYNGGEHPHDRAKPGQARRRQVESQECEGLRAWQPKPKPSAISPRSRRPRPHAAPVHVQKLDKLGRAYATGKRKNAIARVWLKPGKGMITVNDKDFKAYFARPVLQMLLQQPLNLANRATQYDIRATVVGGGLSGQAGAVRHGISKALTYYEPELAAC